MNTAKRKNYILFFHLTSLIALPLFVLLSCMSLSKTFQTKELSTLAVTLSKRQLTSTQNLANGILLFRDDFTRTGTCDTDLKQHVLATARIFDQTLLALTESGAAPRSLDPSDRTVDYCPPAQEPAHAQLKKVRKIWDAYSEQLQNILQATDPGGKLPAGFLERSHALHREMTQANTLLNEQSLHLHDHFKRTLLFMIIASIALTLTLLSYIYLRIEKPLEHSTSHIQDLLTYQQNIFDTVATAVFTVDTNQMITSVNQEFCRLLGFSEDEVVGRHCSMLHGTPCADKCNLFPRGTDHPIYKAECRVLTKSGKPLTIQKNATLTYDHEGKVTGGLESFVDVTELADACTTALQASQAKSAFLANMSHEIRTPLNAVIGMCDLLMTTDMTPEQRDFTKTIHVSGETLLFLISDILDLSKIEAGEVELEMRDFDLPLCIEGITGLMASHASKKGIELLLKIDENVPALIRGDEARLRQILLNLLSNAIKFTLEGEICISVTNEPTAKGHLLTFTVRDTGIGIAADKLDKIFDHFTQADESTTRKFGGTGLGLAISHHLSELMGGKLSVKSAPGEGSAFFLTLAVEKAIQSTIQQPKPRPFDRKDNRVMVVDDNETNLRILNGQLSRWNLEPVSFLSPQAALQSIRKGDPYCLMLTDMQMPGMDGNMLTAEVRKYRPSQELPVILLTSMGAHKPDETLDITAVLYKPVKTAQLYQCIETVFARTQPDQITEAISQQREAGNQQSLKVLLVEDTVANQKVATLMLKKMGYQPDLASDGVEALEKIGNTFYDIILMDVQMPRMDGLTATRKIKKRFEGEKAPLIIGMTAHAAEQERRSGLSAGMDLYLTKPIKLLRLKEILTQAKETIENSRPVETI